jgi:hypothetical protein
MELKLERFYDSGKMTLGILTIDNKFECFALEDTFRAVKVAGETRIPSGVYNVGFFEQVTPKTTAYRSKYPWFKWHIWLKDVPNYTNVYMHVGNSDKDSEGCILVGNTADKAGSIGNSGAAYETFYNKIKKALDNKEKITISIQDR